MTTPELRAAVNARPLRVLGVSESARRVERWADELGSAGFDVTWQRVENEAEYVGALDSAFDIVLCDYASPQFHSSAALKTLRERGLRTPCVIVSTAIGEEHAVEAMRQGAEDYVTHERLARLPGAVKGALDRSRHSEETGHGVLMSAGGVAAEERFRATFEQAAVGLAHESLERMHLAVNQKFCDMTGYTKAELLRMDAEELTHPDDRDDNGDRARLLAGELDTYSNEKRCVRRNGETFWACRTVSLIRDAEGLPKYFMRVIEDISARKWGEAHAALLQATTRAMGEAYGLTDSLKVTLQAICKATGWTFAQAWLSRTDGKALECRVAWHGNAPLPEILGRKRLPISMPADQPGLLTSVFRGRRSELRNLADAHSSKRAPAAMALGFKSWVGIPVLVGGVTVAVLEFFIAHPSEHDTQHVKLVDAVATQIGLLFQRRAADELLRESDERFRQLAEHIPEIFWITDIRQRKLHYLSRAFERVTGRTCEELAKRPRAWLRSVHLEDRERVRHARRDKAHLGTYDVEYRAVHADGTVCWIHDRAFVVRDAQGNACRIVGVATDITATKKAAEHALHLAHYDQLTSLPNRLLFHDRLKQTVALARRNRKRGAVLFVGLDRFKLVNDTLGHAAGDQILMQVSERLGGCVRMGDTASRIGGDEFAVILADLTELEAAGVVGQKILTAISEPYQVGANEVHVTASMGVSLYPSDSEDINMLIRNADAAMYGAKSAGRNMFKFYTAAMNELARERMQLENKLRHALARKEFLLYYQPKVNIVTAELVGFEALLRWQPADGPLVPPDNFIPLLEETGLIVPVGEWVLRAACAQIRSWIEAGVGAVPVAVNVSARQLDHEGFVTTVERILREIRLEPRWIEAEITESAVMKDPTQAIVVLEQLKALGIKLSIDDFGTGYSSLAYLRRFPLDTLKVDRSFVTAIDSSADDGTIARSIITLAHSLGLRVIAEGVESSRQLAFLRQHGCDEAQGYLFDKPLTVDASTALLMR